MQRSNIASKAKSLVGGPIVVKMKDGKTVSGTLVRIAGQRLYVAPSCAAGGKRKSAPVRTKALLPLLLFDVAAIGAGVPYGYGGYGPGPYGGPFGPYGPYGPYGGPQGGLWF
ncbi:hypothetical protein [Paenibacillus sp.]|uniref:hypothetical protein n=1 Tax=Paenibacillus sp. TaxID=58172 RepID=UPI00281175A4|nr:hypothetical protein [Paenibacillus sp.]